MIRSLWLLLAVLVAAEARLDSSVGRQLRQDTKLAVVVTPLDGSVAKPAICTDVAPPGGYPFPVFPLSPLGFVNAAQPNNPALQAVNSLLGAGRRLLAPAVEAADLGVPVLPLGVPADEAATPVAETPPASAAAVPQAEATGPLPAPAPAPVATSAPLPFDLPPLPELTNAVPPSPLPSPPPPPAITIALDPTCITISEAGDCDALQLYPVLGRSSYCAVACGRCS